MNDNTNNRTHAHKFDRFVKKTPEGDVEVFEYTGKKCFEEGFRRVPEDVISVRFHPSVVAVEDHDGMGYDRGTTFAGCHSLKKVEFSEGLKTIGKDAFYECVSLDSINNIPSTVTSIVDGAFYQCISLKKVVLNEGLQEIGWKAFGQCNALESITMPSTVVEIGQLAFKECSNLREVVLNEGLQIIGPWAFSKCISLGSISIPSTVKEIAGMESFANCTQLREVIINGETRKISFDAFLGCTSLERIVFPRISTRLSNIFQAGQTEVMTKIDLILGPVEWRNGELIINPESIQVPKSRSRGDTAYGHNWKRSMECIAKIERLISLYELEEAGTLFELALWKAKIDESNDVIGKDRYAYRIEVPGPVKEKIVQYLSLKSDCSEEEIKEFYRSHNFHGGNFGGSFDAYL